jgi:signal transduction histidine kinase
MTGRRFGIVVLACLAGACAIGARDGVHGALETAALLFAVSAGAVCAGLAARRARASIGPLNRQLGIAVWIAAGAMLAAVWAAAGLMFISADDALLVSVIASVLAVVGASVAAILTDGVVGDVKRLRDRLRAVGDGDRRADVESRGRDELRDVALAANTMIERLAAEEEARSAADEARRQLIVAVSHDLRTPLASLRLLAEAIEDGIATGGLRARYLREMQTHVATLSALVEELFHYSRLQAGEIQLNVGRVELGELAFETAASMRTAAEERGVTVRAEPAAGRAPGEDLAARGDVEQIRRVLLNLLENAISHTPSGGSTVVRVTAAEDMVEAEVADEGTGIAAGDREHVFEAFFRGGEDAARSRDGAGLGLAIARAIVHAHGGDIWLAQADHGTRVCFSLPADRSRGSCARRPAPELSLRLPTSSGLAG